MEFEQRLLEHRGAEGGAGPVVVDRGALVTEQHGGLPNGVGGPWAAAQRVFGGGGPQRRCRHPTEADGGALDDTIDDVKRECDCDA